MMKKVLSIVLVLTMIAALATGCAKAPADNGGGTNLTGSLADIVDKIYAAHPVDLSLGERGHHRHRLDAAPVHRSDERRGREGSRGL